jgi:hypothetical protein
MLNERNKNIPKPMQTVMNELISVMKVNELDIGLTKRAWLDVCVPHTSMITEKVMRHITNVVESYLMLGKRVDGDNSNIRIALSGPTENHPAHRLAIGNNHALKPLWDERRGINKLIRHLTRGIRAYCSSSKVSLLGL